MKPTRSEALSAPVQPFTFHDTTLDVARDNGDLWVSIRRVCEALGLGHGAQAAKLRAKPWGRVSFLDTRDTAGRVQPAAYLHLEALPMWLATIEPSRVSEEARPRLERFQLECARALRDHFFGEPHAVEAPPPRPAHEVELPQRPTAGEYEAKRDAMVKRAWDSLDAAGSAMQEAWIWEDNAGRATMHASLAKILVELPFIVREYESRPQLDRALETVLTQVLTELRLWRFHRGYAAAAKASALSPAPQLTTEGLPAHLDELLLELAVLTEGRRVTAGEILTEAKRNEGLRTALERAVGWPVSAKSLGRLLLRVRGAAVQGWCVAGERGGQAKQWSWWVERGEAIRRVA